MTLCPICNTESTHKVFNTDGQTLSPYWICNYCDLWYQNPLPPKVYEADHEKDEHGGFKGHLMSDQEKQINKDIAGSLFIEEMQSIPGKCLDVGTKYGWLSKCLKDLGCEAYGMDNLECEDEYSKELGIPILVADFEAISDEQIKEWTKTEKFKLITLVHMFEHLYDPLAALKKMRSLISDDGSLYIRMPDHSVRGYERDLTEGHYTIHPYYHSVSSILALLVKGQNLFKVSKMTKLDGWGQTDLVLKPINKKPTLYCGIITKNEERDLPRCIESILPIIDKLVVIDTGSTDNTKQATIDIVNNKIPLDYFVYTDASQQDETGDWKLWDFGKARNIYASIIEADDNADYLLWMDSDDKLLTPDNLQRALYCDFADAFGVQIQTGNTRWIHCRLWKTKKNITYDGRVHEYPVLPEGIRYENLQGSVIEHDPEPGTGEGANPRNLRILEAEFKEDPNSTRLAFYLGNTHKDAARYDEAIPYYAKRIELGQAFRDEWLFAYLYKARCERAAGHLAEAENTLFKGISEAPVWSEFWMELSYMAYTRSSFEEAIGYALLSASRSIPPTQLWRENDKYLDQPLRMISWAYEELGNFPEALDFAKKAKDTLTVADPDWDLRISRLESRVLSIIEKSNNSQRIALLRPGAIGDVLMTLNLVPELQKKWPNHSIDYFCAAQIGANLKELMTLAGISEVLDCTTVEEHKHKYDRIFNMIGYPIPPKGNYPEEPMKKHLIEYFAEDMEIAPAMWSLTIQSPQMDIPNLPEKYCTIQTKTGWSAYKEWPIERWEEVIKACPEITFIQIGAQDEFKVPGAIHSYMGFQLMLSVALVANAKMHVGLDSFCNHLTHYWWQNPTGTAMRRVPGVILWGSTQASASGYDHNTNISLGLNCQPCFKETAIWSRAQRGQCENPPEQSIQHPKHACMHGITVEQVVKEVKSLWSRL